jgi:hypothetical protein
MVAGAGSGAALGAGVGAIPGGMAGAALAETGVDAAQRGLLRAFDPEYSQVMPWAEEGKELGKTAAIAGASGAVGPAFKAFRGPISGMAKVGGTILEGAGGLANKVIGAARRSPFVKDIISFVNPVTSGAATSGMMAQLPKQAMEMIPKAVSYVGSKMPGSSMARYAEELGERSVAEAPSYLQKFANIPFRTRKPPLDLSAEQIGKTMGADVDKLASSGLQRISEETAKYSPGISEVLSKAASGPKIMEPIGKTVGKGADVLYTVGKPLEQLASGATSAQLAALQGLARTAQYGGRGLKGVGTLLGPMEPMLYGRSGLQYLKNRLSEESGYYPWTRKNPIMLVNR